VLRPIAFIGLPCPKKIAGIIAMATPLQCGLTPTNFMNVCLSLAPAKGMLPTSRATFGSLR
jgi:hypothetical protein